MSSRNRLLALVAALLLFAALLQPLWTISLEAPQYPEGIGLKIWAYQITGQKEQDLHNINGLNHYIGMKTIEPDSIPELRILPPLILALGILGLVVAWIGRRWLLGLWLLLIVVGGAVGLVDFWRWEYDYGHNLNPDAAIKVPGMSYQPPLLGTRQLLNMRTTSLPGLGGLAVGAALALGATAWWSSRVDGGSSKRRRKPGVAALAMAPLLVAALALSCKAEPRDIRYRQDTCARCRMFVMDPRYGAELVTRHGKILVFDSVECLAAHTLEDLKASKGAQALLVTHYARPKVLATAETGFYLQCGDLPSPMGLGLSACATRAEAEALQKQHGGKVLDWPGVISHVRDAWRIP